MSESMQKIARWKKWLLGVVVVAAVGIVGGPYVFIHFIEGPAQPRLALPSGTNPSSTSVSTSNSGSSSISGTWQVSSGSQVGYRVKEILFGQSTTAVGRGSQVTGDVTINGTTITAAQFNVRVQSIKSNQAQRNAQFDIRIMDVVNYPTAAFVLTKPIHLTALPTSEHAVSTVATGDLTLHGQTHVVTFPLQAERVGTSVDILGDLNIVFAHWEITNPSIAGFVTTANHGLLEVLLHLSKS
jgi:polyisoprenoid-binding protein YceI